MPLNARLKLRQFQKTLYEKAFAEAQGFAAINSKYISRYGESYFSSLPRKFEKSNLKSLVKTMNDSDVMLYGDFHTHKQSQRGLIRILRSYCNRYNREIVLALEMFRWSDEPVIESYFDGEISEEELLRKCNYGVNWGFPWENYRPIIEFAKENGFRIIGVGSESGGRDRLDARDRYAAKSIHESILGNKKALVVCLIGEYHLADQHIVAELINLDESYKSKCLRVVCNVDHYYFKTRINHSSITSEYLKLKKNFYCVLNSPPWIKWQSYVIWEEMRNIEALSQDSWNEYEDSAGIYTEDIFDIDYQIITLTKNLSKFLHLTTESFSYENFSVFLSPEQDIFERLQEMHKISSKEIDVAIERTALDGHFYLNGPNAFLISDLTLNNLSESIGRFLFSIKHSSLRRRSIEDQFYFNVLSYAAGVISAKILNPRMKGIDFWYLRRFLQYNAGKKLLGHAQIKREAAKKVLSYHDRVTKKLDGMRAGPKPFKSVYMYDSRYYNEISSTLGKVLGFSLYKRVMGHSVHSDVLRDLFLVSGDRKSIESEFYYFYRKIVE